MGFQSSVPPGPVTTPPTRRWAFFVRCILVRTCNCLRHAGSVHMFMECAFPLLLIVVLVFPRSSIGFAGESIFEFGEENHFRVEAWLGTDDRRFSSLGLAK